MFSTTTAVCPVSHSFPKDLRIASARWFANSNSNCFATRFWRWLLGVFAHFEVWSRCAWFTAAVWVWSITPQVIIPFIVRESTAPGAKQIANHAKHCTGKKVTKGSIVPYKAVPITLDIWITTTPSGVQHAAPCVSHPFWEIQLSAKSWKWSCCPTAKSQMMLRHLMQQESLVLIL